MYMHGYLILHLSKIQMGMAFSILLQIIAQQCQIQTKQIPMGILKVMLVIQMMTTMGLLITSLTIVLVMENSIGPVLVISTTHLLPQTGIMMDVRMILPKIQMTTMMAFSMLTIHVHEQVSLHLAQHGFLTQLRTWMVMDAEILMKIQMMMVMDLKTLQMIAQQ